MTPLEAADYLEAQDWEVSWRRDSTTMEGPVSIVASEPPEGVITDVAELDRVAVVFVVPSDDPLLDQVEIGAGCPQG